MKLDPYQMTVEVVSTLVLAGLAVCSFLAIGLIIRIIWEGLRLGFTMFGFWPL